MPGASAVDGSFAPVACVLREATHSHRATDCLPPSPPPSHPPSVQYLWVWCPVPETVVCT